MIEPFHTNFFSCAITHCFFDIITRLENGETIEGIQQDKTGSYKKAPNVYMDNGDTLIDWLKDAAYVERFIRALNPFFGAMTYFRGCPIKIWSGNYSTEQKYKNLIPGTIAKASRDNISIVTGNGIYFPTSLQIGSYIISDIKEFIRRTNPQAGEVFTSEI